MDFPAVIPVMAVPLLLIVKKVSPVFNRVFHTYDRLNNVVQENVRGIRVVKSFNREDYEINKFKGISKSIYDDFAKGERLLALNSPIMQFFMYACMILISWIGAKAIVASGNNAALGMTTGDLTALFSYATQILTSLMMLSMIFAMLTISLASGRRIAEILEEKTDKRVLDNINLSIASGETVGIIGGTGSSKSSLVQLIPRLYDVTNGRITIRNAVAMVLQKNELFSGTIKENLCWGNEAATDEEIEHACRLACANEFIRAFPDKYATHIEQGGTNISGDQKQRLCIARALLKKPKILILDDSTSAVDTKTDAFIQKSFAEYIPDTTKIIIAQRVSSVQHADQIIVLDDGKIVAIGKHEELLKNCAIYREVYASQKKGDGENE